MATAFTPIKPDNAYAATLKALHHRAGKPVVFANIHDVTSTAALLTLGPEAVATASYAVAQALGTTDAALTLEDNARALRGISPLVRAAGLPLSADLKDGFGPDLDACVRGAVRELGVVGANVEDCVPGGVDYAGGLEQLRPLEEQVERLRRVMAIAAEEGVPDFVLNARTDALRLEAIGEEEGVAEAVRRGKAYLAVGATCVFVWGGAKGISRAGVRKVVEGLAGRVSVKLSDAADGMSVQALGELGVCRVSVGPSLWVAQQKALKEVAGRILGGGRLHGGS